MKGFTHCRHSELVSESNKTGFTLIELLVVVLIIGILASVALPQYTKAVAKARIAQVLSMLQTIQEAEERFYMANGYYTTDKSLLDIDFQTDFQNQKNFFKLYEGSVSCYPTGTEVHLSRTFEHMKKGNQNTPYPGKFFCNGYGSKFGAGICKSLGKPVYSWSPQLTYW